jgi:hypothetical protein
MDDEQPCIKCHGTRTRIIGQSVSPPIHFVTCADCGHSSAVLSRTPSIGAAASELQHVERLVREVTADFALPIIDVLDVARTASGWQVTLRTRTNRIVRVELPSTEVATIRRALTRAISNA